MLFITSGANSHEKKKKRKIIVIKTVYKIQRYYSRENDFGELIREGFKEEGVPPKCFET